MKPIAALCSLCLLLAAGPASGADCENWNTKEFFQTATPKAVTACLQAGADLNARNEDGETPLHVATAANQKPAAITMLLDAGADPNARDKYGKTPGDLAKGNEALKGSDVYRRLNDGQSSVCHEADKADAYAGLYDPEKAYAFGLKIQDAVRKRDLVAFFSLVDGELAYGPRRKYAENRAFHEIFPDFWRAEVLNAEPPCGPGPRGWEGLFTLSNGQIWYRGEGFFVGGNINSFSIDLVYGDWVREEFPPVPVGWKVDGRLLSPQCFVYDWSLGQNDNFEQFAKQFSIVEPPSAGLLTDEEFLATYNSPEYVDFYHNPGKYFGDPIYPFDPIDLRFSAYADRKISLWRNVNDCAGDFDQLRIKDLTVKRVSEESTLAPHEYTILAEISTDLCQDLAPNLPGKCLKSYLVNLVFNTGGSIGSIIRNNIYGLFRMEDGERIIFPLKNFRTKNHARNFLDSR